MSIEEKIAHIAGEKFPGYSYIFDNPYRIDERIERATLPAIVCQLPNSGNIVIRNGRVYDAELLYIGFVDIIPHDANGEDNANVYNAMKDLGLRFIQAMSESGLFARVTAIDYDVRIAQFTNIVTGVFFTLRVEDIGRCM